MEPSLIKKPEIILDEINYHLETIKTGNEQLQICCNIDKSIYSYCEKVEEKLILIGKLINSTKLTIPIKIATEANLLFKRDDNLSIVNVQLINTKRIYNPTGIAFLKLEL
jgi:hypothetical protein